MGRAMLLAAEFPFRAVVGVELNPTLARIGREEYGAVAGGGTGARADANDVPGCGRSSTAGGPCVVFLFNPFGAPVMRRLLTAWSGALPDAQGQLDILYVNNEQERVLERQAGFAGCSPDEVRRSRADAIADHRILANQPDGEYAVTNWEDCSIYRWVGKAAIQLLGF